MTRDEVPAGDLACVRNPDRYMGQPNDRAPGRWQRQAMRECEQCPILDQCERDLVWVKPRLSVMAGIWFTRSGHPSDRHPRFDRKGADAPLPVP